jgi:restriction system protein
MAQVWLSRGGAQGEYEEFLVENGFTGGGWRSIPDLAPCAEYQQIFEAVQGANPESKMRAIGNWAGQLWILVIINTWERTKSDSAMSDQWNG